MAGYNVALTNYTNEQNFPILKASILGVKQLQFSLQTGIKSSAALNIMAVMQHFKVMLLVQLCWWW
jgi:hypothetical protein